MRYLFGLGAIVVIGLVAWIYPPSSPAAADPLISHGYLGFIAGWTLLLIPLGFTVAILGGGWLLFSTGVARMSKAKHVKLPKQVSVSYSPHHRSFPAQPALPAPPIDITPTITTHRVPTFSDLLHNNEIGAGKPLVLGYTPQGPVQGDWSALYTTAVGGLTQTGKSTTTRFLFAQAALQGARFVICDPHGNAGGTAAQRTLAQTLAPLGSCFARPVAVSQESILHSVQYVSRALQTRIDGGTWDHSLILGVDEFSGLMRSNDALAALLATLIERIATEGAKFGVYATLLGQQWHTSRTGSGELRSVLASAYLHRMRIDQARMLSGLPAEQLRDVPFLEPGTARLYRSTGELDLVHIPNTTQADLQRLPPGYHQATMQATTPLLASVERMPNGSHMHASAEAIEAAHMFLAGRSPAEIVYELRGVKSNAGRRYQQELDAVLQLVREGVQGSSSIIGQRER